MAYDGAIMFVFGAVSLALPALLTGDRTGKRDAYARAGIGVYLLVDRQRREVAVFSAPEDDRYGDVHTVPYGKPLALPEPLAFMLDTSSLI